MLAWLINKNLCLEWHLKKRLGKERALKICLAIDKLIKKIR